MSTSPPVVDVFSLGAVLFRCVAGRPAFPGDDAGAVMEKAASAEEAPRLSALRPDAPRALCDLLAAMLAKRKAERPADGGEVARALAQLG